MTQKQKLLTIISPSAKEVDKLLLTADVTHVIGHPKNSTDIKDSAKRLGIPEPMGDNDFK